MSLQTRGYEFSRYVDDVTFFCRTREEAELALFDFAEVLDKQQRLTIQKQKTIIYPIAEFRELANKMLIDRPASKEEALLIWVIGKHSGGDPYRVVGLSALTEEELKSVEEIKLVPLFEFYLRQQPVDYQRIAWLLRRLTQVEAPGAIIFLLDNIAKFTPVLGDVMRYVMRASKNYVASVTDLGLRILSSLKLPIVEHSEYLQLLLLNSFSGVPELDHTAAIVSRYVKSTPAIRREIIRAAGATNLSPWIKERKDEFANMDPWGRRALLSVISCLPGDEAEHWVRSMRASMSATEELVSYWALKKLPATLRQRI